MESLAECPVVLIGKHGSWDEYGDLLAIGSCFECSSDSNLRLAKAYIATEETIHWERTLHISLDSLYGTSLVRCILEGEGGFEFLLEIGVRTESKALGLFSLCIETYEVTCDILDALLGLILDLLPSS